MLRRRHSFARLALSRLAFATLLVAAVAAGSARVTAQDAAVSAVQSTLYFGLKTPNGAGVSEQAWARFLAEEVTPRFPNGLTVLSAYGQGANPGSDAVIAELTKVLIIVHPAGEVEAAKISEIKAKYSQTFGAGGIFHTESDVRIVP